MSHPQVMSVWARCLVTGLHLRPHGIVYVYARVHTYQYVTDLRILDGLFNMYEPLGRNLIVHWLSLQETPKKQPTRDHRQDSYNVVPDSPLCPETVVHNCTPAVSLRAKMKVELNETQRREDVPWEDEQMWRMVKEGSTLCFEWVHRPGRPYCLPVHQIDLEDGRLTLKMHNGTLWELPVIT